MLKGVFVNKKLKKKKKKDPAKGLENININSKQSHQKAN